MNKIVMTTGELMKYFSISRTTVYKWRKLGLPVLQLSPKEFRYDIDKVLAWVEDLNRIATDNT